MEFEIYEVSENFLSIEFDLKPSFASIDVLKNIHKILALNLSNSVIEMPIGLNTIGLALKPSEIIQKDYLQKIVKNALEASKHTVNIDTPEIHTVPVKYTGEDLDEVSKLTGLTMDDIIRLHSEPTYKVGMLGFLPGFPYLLGLNSRLKLGRKTVPKTRVAAGSIAIADIFTGIYPIQSPGGWYILGETDFTLFSKKRLSTLKVGDLLKFEAI